MYIVKFGGYTLPTDQLEMNESGGLSRRSEITALAGYGGGLDAFGTGPDPLETDRISKSFIIEAGTPAALQTAIDNFIGQMMLSQNDWRQGLRALVAQLPDGSQRRTWAKCVEARWTQEAFHFQNNWLGPVEVTWQRPQPVWFDYDDLLVFGDHLGDFSDMISYDFGQGVIEQTINASPATFTITNNGNARIKTGLIEFDGVISEPVVTNNRNKYSFSLDRTLVAGDRFTINLGAFQAKLNGEPGHWSDLTLGTARGQLAAMMLEPGDNNFEIVSASPNCTFRYYFAEAYA